MQLNEFVTRIRKSIVSRCVCESLLCVCVCNMANNKRKKEQRKSKEITILTAYNELPNRIQRRKKSAVQLHWAAHHFKNSIAKVLHRHCRFDNNNNGTNIIEENRIAASTWLRLVAPFPWIYHTENNKLHMPKNKNKNKSRIKSEIERDWKSLLTAWQPAIRSIHVRTRKIKIQSIYAEIRKSQD